MNNHIKEILDEGIKNAPLDSKYVVIKVSSWHMSIFYEHYKTFDKLVSDKGYELIDPLCYSQIRVVWNLKENKLDYSSDDNYDDIGLTTSSKQYYELHKDDPELKPKIVEPDPVIPLTEERLMVIATNNSKNMRRKISYVLSR